MNLQLSWVHCLFSYKWSANDFKCFEGWIRTFPATWDLNICKSSEPQGSLCFRAQVFGFWVLWGSSFFSPGLLLAFFLGQSPSTLFLCLHPLDGCCFSLGEGLVHTEGNLSALPTCLHLCTLERELRSVAGLRRIQIFCINLHITIKIIKVWLAFFLPPL